MEAPGALVCAVRRSLKRVPSAPGYVGVVQEVACQRSFLREIKSPLLRGLVAEVKGTIAASRRTGAKAP